jgi:hypothetical protein
VYYKRKMFIHIHCMHMMETQFFYTNHNAGFLGNT